MNELARQLFQTTWSAVGGDGRAMDAASFVGGGGLQSAFPVTDFASAAFATAALAVAELLEQRHRTAVPVVVDRRLASIWFGTSIRPIGWKVPAPWDPIAGDYRARDGWIRLHTNAPHHRAAAESVLGAQADKDGMARAVAPWAKGDLEAAIVEAGGCAAEMRSTHEWSLHPQGTAVAAEPLVHVVTTAPTALADWPVPAARPLKGVRVLDLTRVLAGPVASRFLAGYGADVLRIDPPSWDEPGVVPEVTLGKRCARLNLRQADDRATFEALLSKSDVLLHGYRPGALDDLGYGAAARRGLAPDLIDVSLSAYGWSGPWATRRGFDSLIQMSSGIADTGMHWRHADKPVSLPVPALDHATGYLMAAAAVRGITERLGAGRVTEARLSLARTAKLLSDLETATEAPLAAETEADLAPTTEATEWGLARRVASPVRIGEVAMQWDHPARSLGSAAPHWN